MFIWTLNSGETPEDETLRRQILEEIYAGAFSGLPAMLADEDEIRNAGGEELRRIAGRYGL